MLSNLIPRKKPDIQHLKERKNIPGLIRALSFRDPDVQSAAVHALGDIGHPAVQPLVSALKKRHRSLRLGAIGALSLIRDADATSALADMMSDPSSEVRWQAAVALGEIGSTTDAVAPLLIGLEDPDKYVRYGSAISLVKVGHIFTDAEKPWYHAALQDWEMLRKMGPAASLPLLNLLRDTDNSVRMQAVKVLGEIGDQNVGPALVRALGDPDRKVRWESALASQKCGVAPMYLPRGLCRRPRIQKNPYIAGFLNFMLPGLGYGYLGKWWGIMIFQVDITLTVWLLKTNGSGTYDLLFPVYIILALHAWYLARNIPEEPA